jgi:hypothetical protein
MFAVRKPRTLVYFFFFFDTPAFDRAMAIAWFFGFPAAISVLMLELITLLLLPGFSGMIFYLWFSWL